MESQGDLRPFLPVHQGLRGADTPTGAAPGADLLVDLHEAERRAWMVDDKCLSQIGIAAVKATGHQLAQHRGHRRWLHAEG